MKRLLIAVAVLLAIVGICLANLHCGGPVEVEAVERIRGEVVALRRENRIRQADELAALSRNLRVMAQRYLDSGDKKKAQRAIGAAQELDKRILELRGESD